MRVIIEVEGAEELKRLLEQLKPEELIIRKANATLDERHEETRVEEPEPERTGPAEESKPELKPKKGKPEWWLEAKENNLSEGAGGWPELKLGDHGLFSAFLVLLMGICNALMLVSASLPPAMIAPASLVIVLGIIYGVSELVARVRRREHEAHT